MAPKNKDVQSQPPQASADPASAQRLFASMASTQGSGKPCSKEVSPEVIPFSGAGTQTLGGGSACPVGGDRGGSSCPVISLSDKGDDARNLMPATPANALSPGQKKPLPTARQASSIPMAPETDVPEHQRRKEKEGAGKEGASPSPSTSPSTSTSTSTSPSPSPSPSTSTSTPKGEEGGRDGKGAPASRTWVYPSQQMFFNAMRRKGWSPDEQDMASVVAIHNAVNERAWQEVVAWETAAGFGPRNGPCGGPRLAKFVGRPRDLSPKARFLNLLGYRLPFDRHDWFVDRCGKERVRYVIDFYNAAAVSGPSSGSSSTSTSSSSPTPSASQPAPVSMHLDVRPALDSPSAAWERLKAAVGRVASRW